METASESRLVHLCLEAASDSRDSIEKWRRQRRNLERLPSHLADSLLRHLHRRRLLFPSLLEVFKHSVEVVELKGDNTVDAEWMAYLGAFHCLLSLNLAGCYRITSSCLWPLIGMNTLKEVDLSRCSKVNDAGVKHLVSISTLEKLSLSETSITSDGVALLSSLTNLSFLDLGGIPVNDTALSSLQVLMKLEYLDLWGSNISNKGAMMLRVFPKLSTLSLAWTRISRLPNLPTVECLNMSNCTIDSIFEDDGVKPPLTKLIFSGAIFVNEAVAFSFVESNLLSFLDVSKSSITRFSFLPQMKALEHLDLSSCMIRDDSVDMITYIGENLQTLYLSKTGVTSAGLAILAGHLPKLATLSLSHTQIDDLAVSYISMMPSLKVLDLSNTNIKGFIHQADVEPSLVPSLSALCTLDSLENLNLESTRINDAAVDPISNIRDLTNLSLKSASLTDTSLLHLSSLSRLTNLGIQDAVLTNSGLNSFRPPTSMKNLDLRGCWLITTECIWSFCKQHPLIKVMHEHIDVSLSDQILHQSPQRVPSRPSRIQHKQGKLPLSEYFSDQRLKYSREELIALQYSSLSLRPPPVDSVSDAQDSSSRE